MSLRDQINAAVQQSVQSVQRRIQRLEAKGNPQPEIVIGFTGASGVPALSGVTPGKATDIAEYELDENDDLVTTGRTLTGYNLASTAVAGSTWIMLRQVKKRGLFVDFEDCG